MDAELEYQLTSLNLKAHTYTADFYMAAYMLHLYTYLYSPRLYYGYFAVRLTSEYVFYYIWLTYLL